MEKLNKKISDLQQQQSNACIFIAGFGGAGKTTLCTEISKAFPDSTHVLSDWFIKQETEQRKKSIHEALLLQDEKEREEIEAPYNWYDWDLFLEKLMELKTSSTLSLNNAWNQKTGKKDLNINLSLNTPKTLILCDGIYVLQEKTKNIGDFNIWIDTDLSVCKQRYFERDKHRSSIEYLEQKWKWFEKYDLPLLELFRKNADFIIK